MTPKDAARLIAAAALLIACAAAGGGIVAASGLLVPGPVFGALLLSLLLAASLRAGYPLPASLERLARWLISHLNLLFIPAAVSVVDHLAALQREALILVVSLTASSVISLVVGALTFQYVARLTAPPEQP
jgi:holin-like protein